MPLVIPLAKNNPLEGSWSPLPERPGSWPWGLSYTAHVSPHRRGTGQPGRAGGTARDGCQGVRRCQNWVLSTGCLLAERSPPHPPPSRLFAGVRGEGRRLEFFRRWGWVGSGGSGIGGSLQDDGLRRGVALRSPVPQGERQRSPAPGASGEDAPLPPTAPAASLAPSARRGRGGGESHNPLRLPHRRPDPRHPPQRPLRQRCGAEGAQRDRDGPEGAPKPPVRKTMAL